MHLFRRIILYNILDTHLVKVTRMIMICQDNGECDMLVLVTVVSLLDYFILTLEMDRMKEAITVVTFCCNKLWPKFRLNIVFLMLIAYNDL